MNLQTTIEPDAFQMTASRGFVSWLMSQQVSLALSTYQTGKLFLVGHNEDGRFSVYDRTFERAMGMAGNEQTIYLASLYQLWRLENVLQPGEMLEGYDRHYVPQIGQTTGELNVHDVAIDAEGRPLFISARFSCLATTSDRYHFKPLWMPKFITRLAGEDRCHLNGLAVVDGKARYVTACAQTDVVDGWREHRRDGGVVIDLESEEVIAQGLSMPHSPRWNRGKLWLLDSGNASFGFIDPAKGKFERVAFCPGFARGLTFVGDYAVVGLSLPRHDPTFEGLSLQEQLSAAKVSPRCGLLVIELSTGDVVEWLRMEEPIRELYDVLALPGVRRPRLVGFKTDEIRTRVWADPESLRESLVDSLTGNGSCRIFSG
jgi:uncharacterized protein (TIGR03032 family)